MEIVPAETRDTIISIPRQEAPTIISNGADRKPEETESSNTWVLKPRLQRT
jgi:hypothetical protein